MPGLHWPSSVVGASRSRWFAGGDRLEDRSDRHFGLAEAPIAAHQPIHRLGLLQVVLHLGDRLDLVPGWFGIEGMRQFVLPGAIRGAALTSEGR